MSRTVDFDAFRQEQAAEPVVLKLGGKTYALPPALPAALALEIVRLHQDDAEDAKPEDMFRIGAGLFGSEDAFIAVMSEARVTMDELGDLIQMIVQAYQPDDEDPQAAPAAGPQ